eukprot:2148933-Pleurochrysis_carterae.AAC.9
MALKRDRVIVDKNEKVLETRGLSADEGTGNIGVDELARIGSLVENKVLRVSRGVNFCAGGASV